MDLELKDKVAVITGGSVGIGLAVAEGLAAEGVHVVIVARQGERAHSEAARIAKKFGVRSIGVPGDVATASAIQQVVAETEREFGGADILINNAGEGVFRKVAEMTPEQWHRNIDLNLNGAFYCSREALARFAKRGGGFIVNISSLAGKNAFSGGAAYNASKAGLNLFGESLMLDHRNDNVRVCSIMPGSVDTEFGGDSARRQGDVSWMMAPEDIADAVALVLRMPPRTMISCIEMRPSNPRK